MSRRSDSRTRPLVAQEAARLMYEEDVAQYFTAKRMAAKRPFGRGGARMLQSRPTDLPSNGEIQRALLALVERVEGGAHLVRLRQMRALAFKAMRVLEAFEPRLIGSVATGHVHRASDIDIQLFSDDPDAPEAFFRAQSWPYERDDVLIRRRSKWCEYQHIRLDADYPIELTVYARRELRMRARSSTDGKPIIRLTIRDLEALLAEAP
jgi:Nucleotidyltransferase domain